MYNLSYDQMVSLLKMLDRDIKHLKKSYAQTHSVKTSRMLDDYIDMFNQIAGSLPCSYDVFSRIYEKYRADNGFVSDWYTIFTSENILLKLHTSYLSL